MKTADLYESDFAAWAETKRTKSWQRTTVQQRLGIAQLLEESPSLRPAFAEVANQAYSRAARLAAFEMLRDVKTLPSPCPYTTEQLLDLDYLP